jgi:hypothetical protein
MKINKLVFHMRCFLTEDIFHLNISQKMFFKAFIFQIEFYAWTIINFYTLKCSSKTNLKTNFKIYSGTIHFVLKRLSCKVSNFRSEQCLHLGFTNWWMSAAAKTISCCISFSFAAFSHTNTWAGCLHNMCAPI